MSKIIECVPNFSEGRDIQVIEAIAKSIRETDGCTVLDVDPGESTNRTVYTFVGSPADVVHGAFNAALVAYQQIDMSKHKGEHPRFGAMDVCPFIPVSNTTMEDCINCAHILAERMAKELHIPIYLYGFAAKKENRKNLPTIRAGEYENLAKKLQDSEWKPDYGPSNFIPKWGATAVGARKFLIAYNVNLIATKEQAHKISLNIRETGRGPEKKGRLKFVQAIGWNLKEHNLAQVSANITDCDVTKLHQLYEEVCKDAKEMKLPVVGSEIVGIVPLKCLIEAADFYIDKEDLFVLDERSKVQLVVSKLGLSQLKNFNPDERIIEYLIKKEQPLSGLPLNAFITSVGSRTATPGGGSVSAAVAAMGAALCTMAGQMSYGKKKWELLEPVMRKCIPCVYRCMTDLLPLIDKDASAFDSYMQAVKLPNSTELEKTRRQQAMQDGIMEAIDIPLRVMKSSNQCWEVVKEIASCCNIQVISDIQVGATCLESGIWGAYQNVRVNLPQINNEGVREKLRSEAEAIVNESHKKCEEILNQLEQRRE